jgi:RNA recognition motif-containing protein
MVHCQSALLCESFFFTDVMFRLYVGSLHFNLTESDIKQVFEPFGELDFVDLHRDPGTGRSKGYCFIQYVSIMSQESCSRFA